MKRVEIFNDNYSALGFGDTLNKLSYLYRTYENEDVEFLFHGKRKVFENIMFLKEFCFKEPEHKKVFIDSEHFLRSEKDFKLINHDYWPLRIKWNRCNNLIAINFYRIVKKIHKLSVNYEWHINVEECKLFHESHKIKENYSTIELSAPDNERGQNIVITDKQKCIENNMKILSECKLFVSSEGGMTHLSRAMRVPTIIFIKKDNYNFCKFLHNFIDKKIQKLVHDTNEMLTAINYFLKYDKFN